LVQYFNYAKGRLNALDRDQRKQERLRTLVEARMARIERQAQAKREAAARARVAKPPVVATHDAPAGDMKVSA
jgi:electron transport complex protein RnfC